MAELSLVCGRLPLDQALQAGDLLILLGQGKNNEEIAYTLRLTEGTVKNHMTNILSWVQRHDRTQAAL